MHDGSSYRKGEAPASNRSTLRYIDNVSFPPDQNGPDVSAHIPLAKIDQASSSTSKGYYNSNRSSRQTSSRSAHTSHVRNATAKPIGNKNRSLVLDNRKTKNDVSTVTSSSVPAPIQPVARSDEAQTTPSASATTTPIATPILSSAPPNQTTLAESSLKQNYVCTTPRKRET